MHLVDYPPLYTRKTIFNLLYTQSLLIRICSKRKEFAPMRRNSFLLEQTPFQKGGNSTFDRVVSSICMHLVDYPPLYTRKTIFNLLYTQSLLIRVCSKRKEFAPMRRNSFLLEQTPFQKGGNSTFDRVVSSEIVSIPLKYLFKITLQPLAR